MKKVLRQLFLKYLSEEHTKEENLVIKYKKSGLTTEKALEIKQKIEMAFEHDKVYRYNDIGLQELSLHIDCDRYKVSEVINKYYSKNFYSLLNEYRINEAKELLERIPYMSVKSIMYEVGFNSKNSFYTAFKRDTGLSPNDYRTIGTYHSPAI